MWIRSQGQEDLLEEGMEIHSSTFAWRILMDNPHVAWWATVHRVAKSQTWLKGQQ